MGSVRMNYTEEKIGELVAATRHGDGRANAPIAGDSTPKLAAVKEDAGAVCDLDGIVPNLAARDHEAVRGSKC